MEGPCGRARAGQETRRGDAGIVRGHLLGLQAASGGLSLLKAEMNKRICNGALVFAREQDLEIPALAGVQGQVRVPDERERIRALPCLSRRPRGVAARGEPYGNCRCGCAEEHDGTPGNAVAWRS